MKTEKHIIKGHFKGKRPHVKVTAYELSTVDCSADKMSGYYSQETTLISDDPEPGYDFAGWSVTGSNVTGNNVRFEGDITAKANYSAHVYNVTLQNDGHGTIAADKTTGNLGDTITLTNSPATHYHFSGYSLTGATLTSNQFNIETNDVIAKGWFSEDPKYNLTLQNDGHGSIGAGKTTGYQGDTTTLSNTANNGYVFSAYTVTGATLNGSTLTFGSQDATAKAWFTYDIPSVKIGNQTWSRINIQIDDGGTGIYKVNNVSGYGVNWGTQYYYTYGAAVRIANLLPGWRLPNTNDIDKLRTAAGSWPRYQLSTTTGWTKNNNGYDTFGFSAAPVGSKSVHDGASNVGALAKYWLNNSASAFYLHYNSTGIKYEGTSQSYGLGFSLRLIKQ